MVTKLKRPAASAVEDAVRPVVLSDWQLAQRCVAGDAGAWDRLYHLCHGQLVVAIRALVGSRSSDAEFVDEIAARVWFYVVSNTEKTLAAFSVDHDCRLSTYLSAVARGQLYIYLRSEMRRQLREIVAARRQQESVRFTGEMSNAELDELIATLSAGEKEFLVWCTAPSSEGPSAKSNSYDDPALPYEKTYEQLAYGQTEISPNNEQAASDKEAWQDEARQVADQPLGPLLDQCNEAISSISELIAEDEFDGALAEDSEDSSAVGLSIDNAGANQYTPQVAATWRYRLRGKIHRYLER